MNHEDWPALLIALAGVVLALAVVPPDKWFIAIPAVLLCAGAATKTSTSMSAADKQKQIVKQLAIGVLIFVLICIFIVAIIAMALS